MDYHAPATRIADRIRYEKVARRTDRAAQGLTTQNFHRNRRRQHWAFVVLVALGIVGLLLIGSL